MKWVDRGPEPAGVAGYARRFTQGWINYFENRGGKRTRGRGRPSDSHWRQFRPALGSRTSGVCWYCERECYANAEFGGRAPTVDHFRPLNKFPRLAYAWSNWVFSCRRCNEYKDDEWPELGYVDPCTGDAAERPEHYFDYDAATGEIIPKGGLSGDTRSKALSTIYDLGLNNRDLLFSRLDHTLRFLENLLALPAKDRQDFITVCTQESVEYAGVTRMLVEQGT